ELVRCLAFVWAARLAFGRGLTVPATVIAATLLTHVRYECGANRTETFMAAAEISGVGLYFPWLPGRKLRWLRLARLPLGVAPWFKQNGIAAGAACGLHLLASLTRDRLCRGARVRDILRPLAAYTASLCAAGAIVLLVLALQGALHETWNALVTFNGYYF